MAKLESKINCSTSEMRPCVVATKEGDRKAFFHRWSEHSEVIGPSPLRGGHSGGTVRFTVAIVEYEDGKVGEISPEFIRFSDIPEFDVSQYRMQEIKRQYYISPFSPYDMEVEKARADAEAHKKIFADLVDNACIKRSEKESAEGGVLLEYRLIVAGAQE